MVVLSVVLTRLQDVDPSLPPAHSPSQLRTSPPDIPWVGLEIRNSGYRTGASHPAEQDLRAFLQGSIYLQDARQGATLLAGNGVTGYSPRNPKVKNSTALALGSELSRESHNPLPDTLLLALTLVLAKPTRGPRLFHGPQAPDPLLPARPQGAGTLCWSPVSPKL